jgi:hypothetical protein
MPCSAQLSADSDALPAYPLSTNASWMRPDTSLSNCDANERDHAGTIRGMVTAITLI